jgi:predicted house-cleaning noncanonical NTP pyrophosphatase (MazG superfamily)
MKKIYNKLIRDKIPEIIESDGCQAKVRVLGKKEILLELRRKVLEEANELIEAENKSDIVNELADILELIDAILENQNINPKLLKKEQKLKYKKRGGFKKGLFLEYVIENK